MKRYIAALDQGTTSSRCILFDQEQNIIGSAQRSSPRSIQSPAGWSRTPMEIWSPNIPFSRRCWPQTGVAPEELAAIGITNQRRPPSSGTGRPAGPSPMPSCGSAAAPPPVRG